MTRRWGEKHLNLSLSPCLGTYHLGDAAMNPGHRKKMEVLNGDPFPFSFSIEMLAVKDLHRKFEVGVSLAKSTDGLFDFGIYSHFFLDDVSYPPPFLSVDFPIGKFPQTS